MPSKTYRAAVIGLGMIGGADQVSGDVLGQRVDDSMDGTHTFAYQNHPRIDLDCRLKPRPGTAASAMKRRTGAVTYESWRADDSPAKHSILSA